MRATKQAWQLVFAAVILGYLVQSPSKGDGLKVHIYDDLGLTKLKVQRVDAQIDFNWGTGSPDPSVDPDTFGIIWSGGLHVPSSGEYRFYTVSDDGVQLFVNDVLVIDHWIDQSATEWSGTITLTGGTTYPIRLVYYENQVDATIRLLWSGPGIAKSIVSSQYLVSGFAAEPADAETTTPTPIARWRFDDGQGLQARDSMGDNHGTLYNMEADDWVGGVSGWALDFDGDDDYVQARRPVQDDFSLAFWVKTSDIGAAGQWWQGKGLVGADSSGHANSFGTALVEDKFAFGNMAARGRLTVFSETSINDGQWHYVVATRESSSGRMQVYLDGNLDASGTGPTGTRAGGPDLYVGCLQPEQGHFRGQLDDVTVFDQELTANQIAVLMEPDSRGTPMLPGLVSYWPGEGDAQDVVGPNHGTPQGNVTFAPGKIGQGFLFSSSLGLREAVIASAVGIDDLQQFSIASWVRLDRVGGYEAQLVTLDGKAMLCDEGHNPGQLDFYMMTASGTWAHISTDPTFHPGHFRHVTGTYDGDAMRLYVDGALVDSCQATQPPTTRGMVFLGLPHQIFDGMLDEVQIYDRALSAHEVQMLCAQAPTPPLQHNVLYVDGDARGANSGTSWQDAFQCLQDALAVATPGSEIRVAQGTYKPSKGAGHDPADWEASFHLKPNVTLMGGYAGPGGRSDPNRRDWGLFPTILSGDLNDNDVAGLTVGQIANHWSRQDNSYHIVTTAPDDANGILDGFIISGGHADGSGPAGAVNPSYAYDGNYSLRGGGFYCAMRSSPIVRNCRFTENYANEGGGLACYVGQPILDNCMFTRNVADMGGAIAGASDDYQPPTAAHLRLSHCTFTRNSAATYGGAIANRACRWELRDCSFAWNDAPMGGAIRAKAYRDPLIAAALPYDFELQDCTFLGNGSQGIFMDLCKACISGTVQLQSESWQMDLDLTLTGSGTLQLSDGSKIASIPGVSRGVHTWTIDCNVCGDGAIEVPFDRELIVEGQARVEVGRINCGGLLRVRGSAQVLNSHVTVRRGAFEDNAIVANSVIVAEAGAPYGQFFVEETAQIGGNEIHADGDRYMDLDPSIFAGLIEKNRIYVTVTEGIGSKGGGLLELRGRPGMESDAVCDPNHPLLCQVPEVPRFDPNSWMIEELRLVDGAKVNLTNRFDFQPPYEEGGSDEVLYVRNLYLGRDSVLNTSFNRVYYEHLIADPCAAVENVPLLGFSLNNIAFDDEDEFAVRIATNNVIHREKDLKQYDRIHVQRIIGREPDPAGVMQMSNLRDPDPDSPTFGQTVYARAKGLFAKSSEPWIQIRFEYLFTNPEGGAAIMIYLSDIPELPGRDDPVRRQHYLEVARLWQPPAGRPGSAGSGRWGVFDQVVSVQHLNFIRGTRIELELVGPEGTCVFINNFDPAIRCTYTCGDVAGAYHQVNAVDFLAVLSECGRTIDDVAKSEGRFIGCLDGFFCADGYVTVHDAMAVDWIEQKNLCPDELSATDLSLAAYAYHTLSVLPNEPASLSTASTEEQVPASVQPIPGQFLVAAKRYEHHEGGVDDFLSDRLYGLDPELMMLSEPIVPAQDRFNGKIVRDDSGSIYQLNLERGLVRLADGQPIVSPGNVPADCEPRYGLTAQVYVGLQSDSGVSWGRPLLDAAFDAQGGVYVVPVVVAPTLGTPYLAAARLKLEDPSQGQGYTVEQIFDDPPAPNDNHALTQLREVEVDPSGNLYVLNCHHLNHSDLLWVYDDDGQLVGRRELQNLGINAPLGLRVSSYDPSKLYLASAENPPDANSVTLYILSSRSLDLVQIVEIHGMGHITDIAENPATGTICVVGFQMQVIPSESQIQDPVILHQPPFYQPRLAAFLPGDDGPVNAMCPTDIWPPSDMALPLSVIGVQER